MNATTIATVDILRKIVDITKGLPAYTNEILKTGILPHNKANLVTICDYISSMIHEVNLSDNYRKDVIMLLARFSIFFNNTKVFKDIARADLLQFLDSYRKHESSDPKHKYVATYNLFRIHLMRFYKWLYSPNIEHKQRPKPAQVENIPQLKRKEISCYKPTDLWTQEDDALFLMYCPSSRDKCYHAMSRDSACRPHELLKLRIKDVMFKLTSDKRQYAEISVNGKTGTRSIPLINSIPYVKDWINQHPQSGNQNSILLCGFGRSLGKQLNPSAVDLIYRYYQHTYFPKLKNIPQGDKNKIAELLKKPWNPYIRRHSALTEKSGILKEHHLRQYAGWAKNSNMAQKYLQYFGNESSNNLLEAAGIITSDKQHSDLLKSKSCPNCKEPNKPDSKFCINCQMVLTYDEYSETLEKQQQRESEVQSLRAEVKALQDEQKQKAEEILCTLAQFKEQLNERDQRRLEADFRNGQ
ncbi:MAG: hypothetical protein DLM72_13885 [Candidatus Nitrosopolaris wilkensis]|nr:MAG: hypothetical protein DLM72_13885 [Candidatus Nitrosopolaris wilkensis]